MTDKELVERLRENAEWAQGNEWETPLCLADDLTAAADAIERLQADLATVAAERDRYKAVHENPQPSTNADRIRAMDDKELAEFIDRCEAAGYNDSSVALDKNNNLMDTLDWLQQPAEEAR